MWRFFGADEPNYATMKDGRKLLVELGKLRAGEVYFRAHNLLNTGDGTPAFKWGSTNAYTEDARTASRSTTGRWSTGSSIPISSAACAPICRSASCPKPCRPRRPACLISIRGGPGFDYKLIATGWSYPPKSYEKWGELVYQWTLHNVERYGRDEVEKWYFEVWNEPNSNFYWQGTPEEFYKLHDVAIAAVRRALARRRGSADRTSPAPAARSWTAS